MPQYYTGADSTQAFSGGLMAGYEFIDRIKARKEQIELEKRQQARADEQFELYKGELSQNQIDREQTRDVRKFEFGRTQIQAERDDKSYKHNQERLPELELREKELFEAEKRQRKLSGDASELTIEEFRAKRKRQDAMSGMIKDTYGDEGGSPTLGGIASRPWEPQPDGAGPASQSSPPSAATAAPVAPASQAAPKGASADPSIFEPRYPVPAAPPKSLTEQQAEIDRKEPTPLQRAGKAFSAVGEPIANALTSAQSAVQGNRAEWAKGLWKEAAHPEIESKNSVLVPMIRRDLPGAVRGYLQDRKHVDPADRLIIDENLSTALGQKKSSLEAQLADAPPNERTKLETQIRDIEIRAQALTKQRAITALEDQGVGKGEKTISASDPRAAAALEATAKTLRDSQTAPTVSAAEDQLRRTRLGRIDDPTRLTREQFAVVADAFAHGDIDPQTFQNWQRYHGPLAPIEPKSIALSGGIVFQQFPNGQYRFLEAPGAGRKTSAEQNAERSAKQVSAGRGMSNLTNYLSGAQAQGLIPDAQKGTGGLQAYRALEVLQANLGVFQQRIPQVAFVDERGELDVTALSDPKVAGLVGKVFVDVVNGVKTAGETTYPVENAGQAARNIPVAQPRVRSFQYGDVKDEHIYVGVPGGEGLTEQDWQPIRR